MTEKIGQTKSYLQELKTSLYILSMHGIRLGFIVSLNSRLSALKDTLRAGRVNSVEIIYSRASAISPEHEEIEGQNFIYPLISLSLRCTKSCTLYKKFGGHVTQNGQKTCNS